jgi:hypothetical protein
MASNLIWRNGLVVPAVGAGDGSATTWHDGLVYEDASAGAAVIDIGTGIASIAQVGSPTISVVIDIGTGIDSIATVGAPSLLTPTINVGTGIDSIATVGSPLVLGPINIGVGIASIATVGTPTVAKLIELSAGIASVAAVGTPTLARVIIVLTGIPPVSDYSFQVGSPVVLRLTNANSNFATFIGGTNRQSYVLAGSINTEEQIGFQGSCSFDTADEDGVYYPTVGEEVLQYFYNEDTSTWIKTFGGSVESIVLSGEGDLPMLYSSVTCINYARTLSRRILNAKYLATQYGTVNSILEHINTTILVPEGITWVRQADPGVVLGDLEFRYIPLNEVLDRLTSLCQYTWQVDKDKNFYFFDNPVSVVSAPFDITQDTSGPNGQIWRNIKVTKDRSLLRNIQYVRQT